MTQNVPSTTERPWLIYEREKPCPHMPGARVSCDKLHPPVPPPRQRLHPGTARDDAHQDDAHQRFRAMSRLSPR